LKGAISAATWFLDIGGVLLIKGRDHHARIWPTTHFKLQWASMEGRHHLDFAVYAEGRLTMDEYREQIPNPSARHGLHLDGSMTKESSFETSLPIQLSDHGGSSRIKVALYPTGAQLEPGLDQESACCDSLHELV
jgi:hypothetical protein